MNNGQPALIESHNRKSSPMNGYRSLTETKNTIKERDHRQIHRLALDAVQNLKVSEARLIEVLQKVDEAFTYRQLGYNSLYQYGVQALNLSEYQAYTYISVARKSKAYPQLNAAIKSGEVTVSKARKITSVLSEKTQTHWIELAKKSSTRELEKHVAKENPRERIPEKARYLTDTLLEVQLPLDEEIYKKLLRAQDLLSTKSKVRVSLESTLDAILEFYLKRFDPVEKAKRAESRTKQKESVLSGCRRKKGEKVQANLSRDKLISGNLPDLESLKGVRPIAIRQNSIRQGSIRQGLFRPNLVHGKSSQRDREPISSSIRHHLYLRSKGRCEYSAGGKRCEERKWLDIHHVKPVSLGGGNEPGNLMLVCRGHHRVLHRE